MNTDIASQLAGLDAAPARELTTAESARREELLGGLLREAGGQARAARGARRRAWSLTATVVGAVAAAGALVLVVQVGVRFTDRGQGPLTTAELASWTNSPSRLDLAGGAGAGARSWCLDAMKGAPGTGEPVTITNADVRGTVDSMVVHRGGHQMLCLAGPDGTGLWELIDPVEAVAPEAITVGTSGSHGDGDTGFTYVEGSVGRDVRTVTVHDAGRSFTATVQDGRWTAWWPTPDPHGTVTGKLTLGLADATTRTVDGESLYR